MEDLQFLVLTLFFIIIIKLLITKLLKPRTPLPPGPTSIPFITPLIWLRRSFWDIQSIVRKYRATYGPILTLRLIISRPSIFVADRHLAHHMLIQRGAEFADRPTLSVPSRIFNSNGCSISTANYGSLWRQLRRNITSHILHPSRIKLFSGARKWVLGILIDRLKKQSGAVVVMESFQFAMFSLLVLMCFGEKLDEERIADIEAVQRNLLSSLGKFAVFAFFPRITRVLFRSRWNFLLSIRRRQEELFVPLIKKRREQREQHFQYQDSYVYSYVDSLVDLELENGGRKLNDDEIVSLCSEFLNGGTDTTATALQWIVANLVKQQNIQEKLFKEIEEIVGYDREEVQEDDLPKLQYLKAVIMEGLRRHPPAHFLLSHAVSEDAIVNGYLVPKRAAINFNVADIGWDEKVWEAPMEFEPERFMDGGEGSEVDLTGSREIKMMPFGAGRRICPGIGLALLHLEYFVANLVREFQWLPVAGETVDLTEKLQFTVVMKNPLRAQVVAREKKKRSSSLS